MRRGRNIVRALACGVLAIGGLGTVFAQTQAGFWGRLAFDTAVGEGDNRFRYGNWYGPGWWGGSELSDRVGGLPPVDALDAVAQKHDFGYELAEELGAGNRALEAHYKALADVIAVRDTLALPEDPRRWSPPAKDPELARKYRERIALGFPNYQQRLNELKAVVPSRIDPSHPEALDSVLEGKKPIDAAELERRMNQRVRAWNKAYMDRQAQSGRANVLDIPSATPPAAQARRHGCDALYLRGLEQGRFVRCGSQRGHTLGQLRPVRKMHGLCPQPAPMPVRSAGRAAAPADCVRKQLHLRGLGQGWALWSGAQWKDGVGAQCGVAPPVHVPRPVHAAMSIAPWSLAGGWHMERPL